MWRTTITLLTELITSHSCYNLAVSGAIRTVSINLRNTVSPIHDLLFLFETRQHTHNCRNDWYTVTVLIELCDAIRERAHRRNPPWPLNLLSPIERSCLPKDSHNEASPLDFAPKACPAAIWLYPAFCKSALKGLCTCVLPALLANPDVGTIDGTDLNLDRHSYNSLPLPMGCWNLPNNWRDAEDCEADLAALNAATANMTFPPFHHMWHRLV